MSHIFDTQAPKKPTNVSVNSDLLTEGKKLKKNLSATLESSLIELVSNKQRELWKEQNKTAIKAYNQLVDKNGVFSDEFRNF